METRNDLPLVNEQLLDNLNRIGYFRKKVPSGISIYQNYQNERIGYRVSDRLINNYQRNDEEAFFLQKLLTYGQRIKEIDFPRGVLTYQSRIIGQIITYYVDNTNLIDACKKKGLNPYTVCLKAFELIKNLHNDGIIYIDIHGGNFLYTNEGLKIIDFEKEAVSFIDDEMSEIAEDQMLLSFIRMINRLSNQEAYNLLPNLKKIKNLDDLYYELRLGEVLTLKKTRS